MDHTRGDSSAYDGYREAWPSQREQELKAELDEYRGTSLTPDEITAMKVGLEGYREAEAGEIKTAYDERGIPYLIEAEGNEAEHIVELLAAERDGRLVVLPCKVGDTVYAIEQELCDDEDCSDVYHDYVDDVHIDTISYQKWDEGEAEVKLNDYLPFEDVYLTREEAEAALEAEKESANDP